MVVLDQFPDELVAQVLSLASTPCHHRRRTTGLKPFSQQVVAIALVCRRFYRLMIPSIYTNPHVSQQKTSRALRELYRMCFQNTDLHKLVRGLVVEFSTSKNPGCESMEFASLATDFLSGFPSIKSLGIVSKGSTTENSMLQVLRFAARHNKGLERLALESDVSLVDLDPGIDIIGGMKGLRTLELSNSRIHGTSQTLEEKAKTAPFTELRLIHVSTSSNDLMPLVQWPINLEVFILDQNLHDSSTLSNRRLFSDHQILDELYPVLYPHTKTLRALHIRVRIDHLLWTRAGIAAAAAVHTGIVFSRFDLRCFDRLTDLTLSVGVTGTDPSFVSRLLSPNLRFFCWSISDTTDSNPVNTSSSRNSSSSSSSSGSHSNNSSNMQSTQDNSFSQAEEDWLRTLAQEAQANQIALQRIQVEFTPSLLAVLDDDAVYPWDRLMGLAREMGRAGIVLRWDEQPSVSRETFEQIQELSGHLEKGRGVSLDQFLQTEFFGFGMNGDDADSKSG